mmetsp:Transcript_21556/g.54174  ORF Transcript_21556/g.54174 Transcript_21556/m.54174 type:complete len:469 (+) Transcript_21556:51-1457(+)
MVQAEKQPAALPPPAKGQRRMWGSLGLAVCAATLLAGAVVLCSSQGGWGRGEGGSVELSGGAEDQSVSLFKSALASQRSDLAKHRAAEAKARAQARKSATLGSPDGGGFGGGHSKGESDAQLFKQAVSSQRKELAKTRARTAKITAAARADGDVGGMSKSERLSDAKLFQDAIKEQHAEKAKDKATLKKGLVAALKKNERAKALSKAAQQAKVNSELQEILGAASSSGHKAKAPAAARAVPAHGKAAEAKGAKGPTGGGKPAAAAAHARGSRGRKELDELSRVQAEAMTGHRPPKKAAPKPVQRVVKAKPAVLSKGGEERLFKLLEGGDHGPDAARLSQLADAGRRALTGAHLKTLKAPKARAGAAPHAARHAAAAAHHVHAHKAVKKASPAAAAVHKAAAGRAHKAQKALASAARVSNHDNWARNAVQGADKMTGGGHSAKSYESQEIARSDALERSLLGEFTKKFK